MKEIKVHLQVINFDFWDKNIDFFWFCLASLILVSLQSFSTTAKLFLTSDNSSSSVSSWRTNEQRPYFIILYISSWNFISESISYFLWMSLYSSLFRLFQVLIFWIIHSQSSSLKYLKIWNSTNISHSSKIWQILFCILESSGYFWI